MSRGCTRREKCPCAKDSRMASPFEATNGSKLNLSHSTTLAIWRRNIESETYMNSPAAPSCRQFPANTVGNSLLHRTKTYVEISFPHLLPRAWTTKDMILLSQARSLQLWAQAKEAYSFYLEDIQLKLNLSTKIAQSLSESGINVHFLFTQLTAYLVFSAFSIFLPCSIRCLPPPTLKVSIFQKCMKTSIQNP